MADYVGIYKSDEISKVSSRINEDVNKNKGGGETKTHLAPQY